VKYEKKDGNSAGGYSMGHTAEVYLIDPQFNWRMTFRSASRPKRSPPIFNT